MWLNVRPFAGKFMYAVLETGSKQYRVTAGDTLKIERLTVEAGQPVTFDRVLLVNNDGKVIIGSPTVASATVLADVVEHIRGEKKIAFKMKRRKGYHKTIGHRQELTVVKIKEIRTEPSPLVASSPTSDQPSPITDPQSPVAAPESPIMDHLAPPTGTQSSIPDPRPPITT